MAKRNPETGLNDQQEMFCREYIITPDLNATQAYINAGYSKTGAGQSACDLLKNPKVQAFIAKLRAPAIKKTRNITCRPH
jgi:phage terminase small subunit